ncbi:MAG: FtsX-like permease family protein [Gammaproteobacteria bacterium]|nr:FtsX-like permease family protein [Gammaproteobacteria bacterium]
MPVLLLRSQLRFAVRHPVGMAASIVGVTVAVLAVVTVHLVGHSIRDDLDDFSIAGHTHVATGETRHESSYFELRRRWRASHAAPGASGSPATRPDWTRSVVAIFPVIEGYLEIQGQPRRIVGFDPVAASGLGGGALAASRPGTDYGLFMVDDAVMVSSATTRDIAAAGGSIAGIPVTVLEAATEVILADLPTAQRLLGRDNEIDAVWLRLADARSRLLGWLDQLLPGIAASLPRYTDPVIEGFEVTAADRWNPSRRFADAILFNLGMLSLLCLLMAAFIAFQASASNAARRRTEHDRLLAVGASRWTLMWVSGIEGLAIGVIGALAGLALGFVVAHELLQAAMPQPIPTTPGNGPDDKQALALDGWVVGKALACGVLASALGPLAEGRFATNARFRLGFALVAVGIAAIGLVDGGLGAAYVALAAICAAHVLQVVPLAGHAAGPLAAMGRSLTTRANLRGTAARSREIRLALGALSVAAAVAIGMGLMVESLRRDFTEMLDVRLARGIYVQTASDVSESDLDALRAMDGVREARRYGDVPARVDQGPVNVRVAELDVYETSRYGFDRAIGHEGLVNEVGARLLGIGTGDVLDLVVAGRTVPVEIAHVFRDFGAAAPRVILPTTFLTELDPTSVSWRRVTVRTNPDAAGNLTAALGERYGADRVSNHDDIREAAVAVFDRTFVVSRSLAAMALAVAAIGLYAALTSLQASRSREFRLLSAVGHTRAELWRLALSQTVVLGAMALITALPLGLAIAWVLCDFVNPAAFGWSIGLHVDFASIAGPLLLGVLAACAAGALPAYRVAFREMP